MGQQAPLYEWLLYYDPKDPFKLTPGLAESWTTRDMKTWTFKIRKGVQWDKGYGEFTAEDVAFSLNLLARDAAKSLETAFWRPRIKGMKVVDPYTITFASDVVEPELAYQLSPWRSTVFNCKKYVETVGEDKANREPIGTGPYRLAKYVPGSQVELEAIDRPHWRVQPKWDRIVFMNVPEATTRWAMLQSKRIDLASITMDQVKTAQSAGISVFRSTSPSTISILFGGLFDRLHPNYQGTDPWHDIRVREALQISIDRQALNKTFYANLGTYEPQQLIRLAPLSTLKDYPVPYDPERAKRLLKDAGYEKGFTVKIASFNWPLIADLPQVIEAVAGYWEAIGVQAKITSIDRLAFRELSLNDKTNGWLFPWAGGTDSPTYQREWEKSFYSKQHTARGFQYYIDEHLDALYEELRVTADVDRRAKILADGQVHLRKQWATIHLLNVPSRFFGAVPNRIRSWVPAPGATWNAWEQIEPW